MAYLKVYKFADFRNTDLRDITRIQFGKAQPVYSVIFSASQFDDVHISRAVTLEGLGVDPARVGIDIRDANNFTAASWAFKFWNQDSRIAITGTDANDTITGSSGNDILTGGAGADILHGGGGHDRFVISNAADAVTGDTIDNDDGFLGTISCLGADVDLRVVQITGISGLELDGTVIADSSQVGSEGIYDIYFGSDDATLIVTGRDTDLTNVSRIFDQGFQHPGKFVLNGSVMLTNTLTGSDSDDIVNGGNRPDTLSGGPGGNDVLNGNLGDDVLIGYSGRYYARPADDDVLDGGDGVDTVSYALAEGGITVDLARSGPQDTASGGNDELISIEGVIGSDFDDMITGDGRTNILRGGGGSDTIHAGDGADTLYGEAGDDLLDGGIGTFADTFNGGDGVDTVTYQAITTGVGVHVDLSVSGPQNTVAGGSDSFVSIENLIGTTTNDTLTGSDANNLIDGGGGADDNDVLDGGGGSDTVTYIRATAGVTVSLADGLANGGGGHDLLSRFQNVVGSAYADTITGTAGGRFGNGGGNILDGGGGVDTLIGLAGDDTYILASTARISEDGVPRTTYDFIREEEGGGIDTVLVTRAGIATYSLAVNVENAVVQGAGAMTLFGNASNNVLTGSAGDDVLIGRGGDDTLDGGGGSDTASYSSEAAGLRIDLGKLTAQDFGAAGKDTLVGIENLAGTAFADRLFGDEGANRLDGAGGNDRLDGRGGTDTLVGGAGNDDYAVDADDTAVELVGEGYDTVTASASWTLGTDLEKLILAGRAQTGNGNTLDNVIIGTARANALNGLEGADELQGGAGADVLDGGADSDNLIGGTDRDTLTGGAGRDRFTFAAGDTGATARLADLITDFSHADRDRIVLSAIDANATTATNDAFAFIGRAAFGQVAGQLRYAFIGPDTYIQADRDGDGTADLMIRLTGHVGLVTSDFIL